MKESLFIFFKVSTWIAIPVLIALFAGKALDERFETKPWLFLASMGIGFAVSIVGIYRTSIREMKKMETNNKENINGND